MQNLRPLAFRAALNIRALAVGIVVATLLCAADSIGELWLTQYQLAPGMRAERFIPLTLIAWVAAAYAIMIAAICTPIWFAMVRVKLDGWAPAAALGFLATMAFWVISNMSRYHSAPELIQSGLKWAIFGALSGLATRWARLKPGRDRITAYAGNASLILIILWLISVWLCFAVAQSSANPDSLDWRSNELFAGLRLIWR